MIIITRVFELDVVEKGDVSALKAHRVILAIYFDREREEKLQSTVPDVVRVKRKLLHPRWADKDTVLSVIPAILLIWEGPALQTLNSRMNRVSNLQGSKQAKMTFSKHGIARLPTEKC
jgi:hypothetical protein